MSSKHAAVLLPGPARCSSLAVRKAPQLRELNLKSLPYVPLPRAPMHWHRQSGRPRPERPEAAELFEVRDASWRLSSIETLMLDHRPDPAFRLLYAVDTGLLMLDDLGHAPGFGPIRAAVLRYDRSGRLAAKTGFAHDIYRLGVHPLGGFICMSADCVVHAYDDNLKLLFETGLADTPEMRPLRDHFRIGQQQLKHHIRCVALARDNHRYLLTAVDEAWCVDGRGEGLWGVKLPLKEGWKRVATPSDRYGTSSEIQRALTLMNLSLPLGPDQVRRRYRELAMRWHPDHHLGSLEAHQNMQALNLAAELLTGVDLRAVPESGEQRTAGASSFELSSFGMALIGAELCVGLDLRRLFRRPFEHSLSRQLQWTRSCGGRKRCGTEGL